MLETSLAGDTDLTTEDLMVLVVLRGVFGSEDTRVGDWTGEDRPDESSLASRIMERRECKDLETKIKITMCQLYAVHNRSVHCTVYTVQ